MAEHGTEMRSDKGIGFAVLFGLLTAASALGIFVTAGTGTEGWAFAAAMLLGSLLVAGLHVYEY